MTRRYTILLAAGIWLSAFGSWAAQQELEQDSPVVKEYRQLCRSHNIECGIGEPQDLPEVELTIQRSAPLLDGSVAIIVVVTLLVGGVLILVRFGGAGTLLSRAPKEVRSDAPIADPLSLQSMQAAAGSGGALDQLSQIAQMTDKRVALVALLRLCLFHAAQHSNMRAIRSDTERSMFARLPKHLPHRDKLERILRETELAHYGGRDVDQDRFDSLLDDGCHLLRIRSASK